MYPYDSLTAPPFGQAQSQIQNLMNMNKSLMPQVETHTIKVNGRAGAEALTLSPNSDILVLDQNDPIVWFIQSDGAGYKTITPYDIAIHKERKQEDVLKSLEDRITKLEEAMSHGKPNHPANGREQSANAGNRSIPKG